MTDNFRITEAAAAIRRKCRRCDVVKPAAEFGRNPHAATSDGADHLIGVCRECVRKGRQLGRVRVVRVDPRVLKHARELAGGDVTRLRIISPEAVVVLNHSRRTDVASAAFQ